MNYFLLLFLTIIPHFASADTIFLCRSYNGGEFWSSSQCSQQNALIVRMTEVPSKMPFNQQVQLAAQAKAESERLAIQAQPFYPVTPKVYSSEGECAYLETRIKQLDSLARMPLTGQQQDTITAEKRTARSRQFSLKCR